MLKILAGSYKAQTLKVCSGVRPTSVLMRRRFFDRRNTWSGVHFVDLCAGSGAMGLEAFSRGAESISFIESSRRVMANLRTNIQKILSPEEQKSLHCQQITAQTFISRHLLGLLEQEEQEVVVYFDPPYHKVELYSFFLGFLKENKEKVAKGHQVWWEYENRYTLIPELSATYGELLGFSQGDRVAQGICTKGD